MKRADDFQCIHSEGGLLPPDILRRVLDTKQRLPGTQPEDYGLPKGDRINETITVRYPFRPKPGTGKFSAC